MRRVFVGMGGNIGDTVSIFRQALSSLRQTTGICSLNASNFYSTSPVAAMPQDDYVNAVCTFETALPAAQVYRRLEEIERELGKVAKSKDSPRILDLDLLLYGPERIKEKGLEVPHPKWMERLFVLIPLSDLAESVMIPDPLQPGGIRIVRLKEFLAHFQNIHQETVRFLTKPEAII